MTQLELLKEGTSLTGVVEGVSSLAVRDECVFSKGKLPGASKSYLLSKVFLKSKRPIVVILPTAELAEDFAGDLRFFLDNKDVLHYPSTELLPFEAQTIDPDITGLRISFLHSLATADKTSPAIYVVSAPDMLECVSPKGSLVKRTHYIELGVEYERNALMEKLLSMGYARRAMVEARGEMSLRGAILDIFPPTDSVNNGRPLRVEFFGDEVESIRTFDVSTQRSDKELAEVMLLPVKQADLSADGRTLARTKLIDRAEEAGLEREAWEPLYQNLLGGEEIRGVDRILPLFFEQLSTIFDYLTPDTLVTLIEPMAVDTSIGDLLVEASSRRSEIDSFLTVEDIYIDADTFNKALKKFARLSVADNEGDNEAEIQVGTEFQVETNFALRQDILLKKDLSPLRDAITKWLLDGTSVYITAHNAGQAERMAELLEGFSVKIKAGGEGVIGNHVSQQTSHVTILKGTLSSGFRLTGEALVVITEEEIFGERVKRRPATSKKLDTLLTQLRDLNEGDAVVHVLHGIGIYKGLERVTTGGISSDFLLLEYRDRDKLYLPVDAIDLINKYHAVGGEGTVTPDKLGATLWAKKTARARKATREIAGELLKLYAERASLEGFKFSPPSKVFTEFEAAFEFTETSDQERAIDEVMGDMGEAKAMDRLICGDVGYGKTEVAMRAAFRAVLDSKQVAILVPTTILAQQHFQSFTERLLAFPATADVLSRFRSKKEQQETLKKLKAGHVDIIIGTHRILQRDVGFKDLGLIVIDEEHRFGVRHKERLKEMRKSVEVLTLTATPIPRTLNMSLADIRDISIINTPPADRLAIRTRVIRFDDGRIKEAVEREMARGGQVFFVHNRVQSIAAMADYLKKVTANITPTPRIAVAHGQMRPGELEKIMVAFIKGDFDILLSTTIIESGLDIPRANTIIINRADRFGLAELYQLRGRVGRSAHRAYAYLISPDEARLNSDARRRMEVIGELSELGSGFRVAAYDMEIRGAGELLGASQSGRIAEVGFDMYSDLLAEAVKELKGETIVSEAAVEVNLSISRFIPEGYVPDTRQRLGLYKRLATIDDKEELFELMDELTDRYGEIPEELKALFETTRIKGELKAIGAVELTQRGEFLYITFSPTLGEESPNIAGNLIKLVKTGNGRFRFTKDRNFVYRMRPGEALFDEVRYLLKEIAKGC